MTATDDRISLRGGLVVSRHALELLWELERREFRIAVTANKLGVTPRLQLSAEDKTNINQHQTELIALVRYCDDVDQLGLPP